MNHAWEKSVFEGHVDGLKNEQSTMSGKAHMDLSGAKARCENMQSAGSLDHPEKRPLPVGSQLSGGGQHPLVLTPAGLQLAQLQAQLTLHRLKLAQTAASGNTAAAASVLNQVLSNVAMSQPFFNQLRAPTLISTAHGQAGGAQLGPGFPTSALAFPPPSSALGPLVGGGFGSGGGSHSPNPGGMRLNCYGSGLPQPPGQQASEYGKKAGSTFPSSCQGSSDGARAPVVAQVDGVHRGGFQRDLFGLDGQGQPSAFAGEQKSSAFPSGGHKDQQWQGFSQAGQLDMTPNTATAWAPGRQPPFHIRAELYNPEEPTADPKFNSTSGATGAQGFEGYQQLQPGDDSFSRGPVPLQPHQLNDFHAVTPALLPHQCTICDKKVYNLKDWDHHVKGKLHLQNCMLYTEGISAGSANFPEPSQGCLNTSLNNSVASTANQDISTGNTSPYLHAAPMMTHPLTGMGFTLPLSGLKFPLRKSGPGRVVHICNLPEGSCTENDVINLGLPFGKVTNYILMRSTHQAFLEMAFVEAAQAMVKYYQLNPATINEQKLLIRMSKRYKELQLKKPGKDVESIIQDINSQRERHEKQESECYPPERVRSRSPVSRSLSPRSHSPSFTSCSSAHSPPGPNRNDRSNGLGPRNPSWDWSSQVWQDERDEACWRNGDEDQPNGRPPEWRKAYFKMADRVSQRTVEDKAEGQRGGKDRYTRSSPQAPPFLPYRSNEEDYYRPEPTYKPERHPRPAYQRHEVKAKRRDTPESHRSRHSESPEDPKTAKDRNQTSPNSMKSKTPSRKEEVEKVGEEVEEKQKDKSQSLMSSCENVELAGGKDREAKDWDSGEETEGEIWYPGNMEELVTVDEVGEEEEEDSIIEPDLPAEQQEEPGEASQTKASQDPKKDSVRDEETVGEGNGVVLPGLQKRADDMSCNASTEDLASVEWQPGSDLSAFPIPAFQAILDEKCASVTTDAPVGQLPQEALANHRDACGGRKPPDGLAGHETGSLSLTANEAQNKDEHPGERKDVYSTSFRQSARQLGAEAITAHSTTWEQEVFNEHSIPLGVEFIVPRSGFYCKLCGLFYASEEKAKTTHCRSPVHYRNLQYLNHLAEERIHKQSKLPGPASTE
ncbi:RNA-binding protein 20-like isoform X2 [Conger conger]|uniref:RNA-binding protein 20-like isoform X2 n=1 Tax=Conger conger TaxID=82655 RepID=UPI002A5AC46E|nr:RNA-binding protein 20-like isoform X2 [Conger conger]